MAFMPKIELGLRLSPEWQALKEQLEKSRSPDTAERRVGLFWISPRDLAALIFGYNGQYQRPVADGLPLDAVVESVHYEWQRDAFGIMLSHPSFDRVEPGAPIPWVSEIRVELKPANELTLDNLEGFSEWLEAKVSSEILRDSAVDLMSLPLPGLADAIITGRLPDADCDQPTIVAPGDPAAPPPA